MQSRDAVDYALRRRAALADLRVGRTSALDACDAHPYLKLAARHYGQVRAEPCPVCAKRSLVDVHYAYGAELGASAGQARTPADLRRLARRHAEVAVYVVEVCPDCGWNHLVKSFVVGHGGDRDATATGG